MNLNNVRRMASSIYGNHDGEPSDPKQALIPINEEDEDDNESQSEEIKTDSSFSDDYKKSK